MKSSPTREARPIESDQTHEVVQYKKRCTAQSSRDRQATGGTVVDGECAARANKVRVNGRCSTPRTDAHCGRKPPIATADVFSIQSEIAKALRSG